MLSWTREAVLAIRVCLICFVVLRNCQLGSGVDASRFQFGPSPSM